jgi:hypothetical protein
VRRAICDGGRLGGKQVGIGDAFIGDVRSKVTPGTTAQLRMAYAEEE